MKAINFNSKVQDLQTGTVYDFNFENESYQITHEGGDIYKITNESGQSITGHTIRNAETVRDAIAMTFKRSGRATSGEVYRADILREFREDYGPHTYTGINSPGSSQPLNRRTGGGAWGIGFELEVCERHEITLAAMRAFKSNLWQMVTDSSIGDGQGRANQSGYSVKGVEFTSALIDPIHAINPAFYRNFCEQIKGLATSRINYSTGLHCSISREAFGTNEESQNEAVARLVYLCNWIIPNTSQEAIFGRGVNNWAKQNRSADGTANAILTLSQKAPTILNDTEVRKAFAADLLTGNKCRNGHNYPTERYHRINITNPERVEFRQGKGDINPDRMAIIAQFVITTSEYATATRLSKMSLKGYINSIPRSGKYQTLRAILTEAEQE